MENVEIWKDIPGYEGFYKVSSFGSVKSLNFHNTGKERELKQVRCKYYLNVCLSKNGKQTPSKVHKLVAMAFLDHKPDGYKLVVDHINSNGFDNNLENLRIITQRENCSKEKTLKSTLPVGVSKKRNKFQSRIKINDKYLYLGSFNTPEEASNAYQKELAKITH